MARLARPTSAMRSHYDAIVVGSGYGGGVAACRLAAMGLAVAVLERGRELLPGEFPCTAEGLTREARWTVDGRHSGAPDGLFAVHIGAEAAVVSGSALGGGSLVGAGVAMGPDMLVFEDERWPLPIRTDHYLSLGFRRAREMLAPEPMPAAMHSRRFAALAAAARELGRDVERPPLHIAFRETARSGMARQAACTGCGDCLAGCNLGAKTTVHSTYLSLAAAAGAELFARASVRFVEPAQGPGWRVVLRSAEAGRQAVPLRSVSARIVVLAAGVIGTAEVLMRSRERGLPLADQLGKGVSLNLERLAVGSGTTGGGLGLGARAAPGTDPPGPAVTGLIDLRRRRDRAERIAITDFGIPRALGEVLARRLAQAAPAREPPAGARAPGVGAATVPDRLIRELIDPLLPLLALGSDSASGEIVTAGDGVRLVARDRPGDEMEARAREILGWLAASCGGPPRTDAIAAAIGIERIAVDPVGGAGMGEDRTSGVVDHLCRVFDGDPRRASNAVHTGLYVVDGSVVPRPLGVYPLLTITAIAERAMLLLGRHLGQAAHAVPSAAAAGPTGAHAGLETA